MARDIELTEKQHELARELSLWAEKNGILRPGEQLVFSLRIESVPLAVHDPNQGPSDETLDMTIGEFFTKERLSGHDETGWNATRVRNRILTHLPATLTMRDLLKGYDFRALEGLDGLGRRSARVAAEAMLAAGLKIRNYKP